MEATSSEHHVASAILTAVCRRRWFYGFMLSFEVRGYMVVFIFPFYSAKGIKFAWLKGNHISV